MIFSDGGILLYDALFEKITIQGDLIAGFVGALNQFGLKLFPGEELEDIVFTRHHMCLSKHKIMEKEIILLFVHDPKMSHVDIKKITTQLYMELRNKFGLLLQDPLMERSKLFALDEFIEKTFVNERRSERLLPRGH